MYPSTLHRVICALVTKNFNDQFQLTKKLEKSYPISPKRSSRFEKGFFLKIAERLEKLTFVAIISRGW